ncbi:hypothetical protein SUDANB6_01361 [Streptomyces sp. enrichment culture]
MTLLQLQPILHGERAQRAGSRRPVTPGPCRRVLPERQGTAGRLRVRADRQPPAPGPTPLPRRRAVRLDRPGADDHRRPHGEPLRGARQAVRGERQRGERGALHPPRRHPPDGRLPRLRRLGPPDIAACRPHHPGSGLRDGRPADRGCLVHRVDEPPGGRHVVRPGDKPGVMGDLPCHHDDQWSPGLDDRLRERLRRGRAPGNRLRLPRRQSAVRPRLEEERVRGSVGARAARFRGPLRSRSSPDQRRLTALPAAHAGEDEAGERLGRGRQPNRGHLQRLPDARRGCGVRRSGERLARGRGRAARPHFLQHRHQHLPVGPQQPQAGKAQGPGAAAERSGPVAADAPLHRL